MDQIQRKKERKKSLKKEKIYVFVWIYRKSHVDHVIAYLIMWSSGDMYTYIFHVIIIIISCRPNSLPQLWSCVSASVRRCLSVPVSQCARVSVFMMKWWDENLGLSVIYLWFICVSVYLCTVAPACLAGFGGSRTEVSCEQSEVNIANDQMIKWSFSVLSVIT